MSEWISIKDRLPLEVEVPRDESIETIVLGLDSLDRCWVVEYVKEGPNISYKQGREFFDIHNDNESCCRCVNADVDKTPILYWMPLPEKPLIKQ